METIKAIDSSSVASPARSQEPRPGVGAAGLAGAVLVQLACWLIIWRSSLDGVFHFDDAMSIVNDTRIRTIDWEWRWFLFGNRSLCRYSFALNRYFFGPEPYSFHVVNLGIHVTNALLIYAGTLLAISLFRRRSTIAPSSGLFLQDLVTASLIATLWCIHPITTAAVTNLVQRFASMTSMGCLGAWLGLMVFLHGHRVTGSLTVLIMAWLGQLSKENFAIAPLVILLFDVWITGDRWRDLFRRRWFLYALMLSPLLVYGRSLLYFTNRVNVGGLSQQGSLYVVYTPSSWEYLRTQPEILWHYLGLIFWPGHLCFDYAWPVQNDPAVYFPLGAMILVGLGVGVFLFSKGLSAGRDVPKLSQRQDRSLRLGLAGWLILSFYIILAPKCSILSIPDLAFEHRIYLASAVVTAGVVLSLQAVISRLISYSQQPSVLVAAMVLIVLSVVMGLAYRTHVRNLDYQDEVRLWTSTVQVAPHSARAWYNLGQKYFHRGMPELALEPLENAVDFSANTVPPYEVGLAACLEKLGREDEAISLYQSALDEMPKYKEALNRLGSIYLSREQYQTSRGLFLRAAERSYGPSVFNLGLVELRTGNTIAAEKCFSLLIEGGMFTKPAARWLAWIYTTSQDEGQRDVERAKDLVSTHLQPRMVLKDEEQISNGVPSEASVGLLDLLGTISAAEGEFERAVALLSRAIQIAEEQPKIDARYLSELRRRHSAFQEKRSWIAGTPDL